MKVPVTPEGLKISKSCKLKEVQQISNKDLAIEQWLMQLALII